MDLPVFKRVFWQSLLLAIPGLMLCAGMVGAVAKLVFVEYHWDWYACLLFGTILSATDPVAVVALLKDLGASPLVSTLIEGESLFNDGAAIVFFNILVTAVQSESCTEANWASCSDQCQCDYLCKLDKTIGDFALELFRVSLGGVAVGVLVGMATVPLYTRVVNDAMIEISLTFIVAYTTFFVSEVYFHVSGVLGLVAVGCFYSYWRHSISPEVTHTLHHFWEICVYLANTIIFILAGMIVYLKAFDHESSGVSSSVEAIDWAYLLLTYVAINVARSIMLCLFYPLLSCFEYKMNFGTLVLVSWGGLRGAVGLALALIIQADDDVVLASVRHKFIFHIAGIVILTLVVNGVTTQYVVRHFELDKLEFRHKTRMHLIWKELLVENELFLQDLRDSEVFVYDTNWKELAQLTDLTTSIRRQQREDPYNKWGWFEARYDGMSQDEIDHLNREDATQAYLSAVQHSFDRQYMLGTMRRQAIRGVSKDLERISVVAEKIPSDEKQWLSTCLVNPPLVERWFLPRALDTCLLKIPSSAVRDFLVRWRMQNGFDIAFATLAANADAEKGILRWSADKATAYQLLRHCKQTRVAIVKLLQAEGRRRPDVTAALNTRAACRKVLYHMRMELKQIKASGRLLADDAAVLQHQLAMAEVRVTKKFPWTLPHATAKAVLEEQAWYQNASPETQRFLAAYAEQKGSVIEVEADQPLADYASPGDLCVVVVGLLNVRMQRATLAFGAGYTTCWLALLTGTALSTQVSTASWCRLLVLSHKQIMATLESDSAFKTAAWKACGEATAHALMVTDDVWQKLSAAALRKIVRTGGVSFLQHEDCERNATRRHALRDTDDTIRVLIRGGAVEYEDDESVDLALPPDRGGTTLRAPGLIPKTWQFATFSGRAVVYELASPLTASQRAVLRWNRLRSKMKAIFAWSYLRGPEHGRNALAVAFRVKPKEYTAVEEVERKTRILERKMMSMRERAVGSSQAFRRRLSVEEDCLSAELGRLRNNTSGTISQGADKSPGDIHVSLSNFPAAVKRQGTISLESGIHMTETQGASSDREEPGSARNRQGTQNTVLSLGLLDEAPSFDSELGRPRLPTLAQGMPLLDCLGHGKEPQVESCLHKAEFASNLSSPRRGVTFDDGGSPSTAPNLLGDKIVSSMLLGASPAGQPARPALLLARPGTDNPKFSARRGSAHQDLKEFDLATLPSLPCEVKPLPEDVPSPNPLAFATSPHPSSPGVASPSFKDTPAPSARPLQTAPLLPRLEASVQDPPEGKPRAVAGSVQSTARGKVRSKRSWV
eukprot:TRINITY_DN14403_c0_g4_i1.p1 TRINITY_DN14403_c0_g4~~TRINITY_DN14403_c0_g4_i1.p1  ORF type:complete len:1499 (+),score=314.77 TRINITY_DN14403_c0_g4_i1:629-4498(+)